MLHAFYTVYLNKKVSQQKEAMFSNFENLQKCFQQIEKNPFISGPAQFKPAQFNCVSGDWLKIGIFICVMNYTPLKVY